MRRGKAIVKIFRIALVPVKVLAKPGDVGLIAKR